MSLIIVAVVNSYFDYNDITENYLGETAVICEFCQATHFKFEWTVDKKFQNC